jgi:hypothetical protein
MGKAADVISPMLGFFFGFLGLLTGVDRIYVHGSH